MTHWKWRNKMQTNLRCKQQKSRGALDEKLKQDRGKTWWLQKVRQISDSLTQILAIFKSRSGDTKWRYLWLPPMTWPKNPTVHLEPVPPHNTHSFFLGQSPQKVFFFLLGGGIFWAHGNFQIPGCMRIGQLGGEASRLLSSDQRCYSCQVWQPTVPSFYRRLFRVSNFRI